MSIRCLFGHKFAAFSVTHYYDTSYSAPPAHGAKSTHLTSRCVRCGAFKVDSLYGAGHLPLAEFQITEPVDKKAANEAAKATQDVLKKFQTQDKKTS